MKKVCKLCGEQLRKGKNKRAKYCDDTCRLIASKIRRGIISVIHAQRLLKQRTNKENYIKMGEVIT